MTERDFKYRLIIPVSISLSAKHKTPGAVQYSSKEEFGNKSSELTFSVGFDDPAELTALLDPANKSMEAVETFTRAMYAKLRGLVVEELSVPVVLNGAQVEITIKKNNGTTGGKTNDSNGPTRSAGGQTTTQTRNTGQARRGRSAR